MIGYEHKNGLTYRHRGVIDWMLSNPEKPLKEAQEATGFTPQYLYTLRKSDMFRAEYERRRAEIEAALHVEMVDKWSIVEEELLDKMITKLKGPVSEKFLLDGLNAVVKRSEGPSATVQINTNNTFLATPEQIRQARERAAELTRGRGQTALPAPEPAVSAGKDIIDVEVESIA